MDPLGSEPKVGLVGNLTHDLLRVPRKPHLASWVAGAEQSNQRVVLILGESFSGHYQSAPGAVERIVFAAAMPRGFVLHSTPALVEGDFGEFDGVERVGNMNGGGNIV